MPVPNNLANTIKSIAIIGILEVVYFSDKDLLNSIGRTRIAEAELRVLADRNGISFEELLSQASGNDFKDAVIKALKDIYLRAFKLTKDSIPDLTVGSFDAYRQSYYICALLAGTKLTEEELQLAMLVKLQEVAAKKVAEIQYTAGQIDGFLQKQFV